MTLQSVQCGGELCPEEEPMICFATTPVVCFLPKDLKVALFIHNLTFSYPMNVHKPMDVNKRNHNCLVFWFWYSSFHQSQWTGNHPVHWLPLSFWVIPQFVKCYHSLQYFKVFFILLYVIYLEDSDLSRSGMRDSRSMVEEPMDLPNALKWEQIYSQNKHPTLLSFGIY